MICYMATFGEWLQVELTQRKIGPTEFARLAQIDPGAITRYLNGEREPRAAAIMSIANALDLPSELVLAAVVGETYAVPGDSPLIKTVDRRLSKMSEEKQIEVLAFIEMVMSLEENREKSVKSASKGDKVSTNTAKP